jgi:hypothetical protein
MGLKSDSIWGNLERAQLMPCIFGHNAIRCFFIYNASMDGDISYY